MKGADVAMIANMNEKGRQVKLLAAIAVLAMVVCAFAVAIPSDVDAAEAPSGTYVATENVGSVADIQGLKDSSDNAIYSNGILTVPAEGLSLNLTQDIGSSESPMNLKIVLNGDLRITSTTNKSIYIQAVGERAYTLTFNADDTVFEVSGANVILDANGDKSSVINNMYTSTWDFTESHVSGSIMATNGATLTIKHTSGGSTWLDAAAGKTSLLYVNNATVKFDDAHGVQSIDVMAENNAKIDANMSDGTTLTGYFNLSGTTLTGTSVSMYAAKLVNSTVTVDTLGTYSGTRTPANVGAYGSVAYEVNTINVDPKSSVDAVKIINDLSTAALYEGTSTIKFIGGGSVSGNFTDVSKTGESSAKAASYNINEITLTGTNTVSSNVTLDGKYTVAEKSALNVNDGATLKGEITNYGAISINSGAITADDKGDSYITLSNDSTGTINVTGTSTAVLGGTIDSTSKNTEFGIGQVVDVVDNLIIDGATVTINGILNNSDGYSIDIINGGKLIIGGALATFTNDGVITVEATDSAIAVGSESIQIIDGAKFVNNGTVMLESSTDAASYLMSNSGIIDNNGSIEIVDGVMSNNGTINNKAGAVFTISGTFTAGNASTFNNSSSIVVNGIISGDGATIGNVAEGATVTVSNVTGKITVSDSNLESKRTLETGDNTIALNSTNTTESVGGVIITSAVVEVEKKYYKEMQISGTFDVSLPETDKDGDGKANFFVDASRAVVSDNLNLGDNLNVLFDASTNLYVAGNMNITDAGSAKFQGGNVFVTGMIVSVDEISGAKVNAAMYNALVGTQKTYYYTTLDKAIEGASSANVNRIEILNQVTLDVDATVPSGITVYVNTGSELLIDEVTLTVADGGKINNRGTIDVDGTLYVTIKKTGISGNGTIESDVVSRGEQDVRYTTLANAIAAAGSEEVTITLNGNVCITSDLTIPSNITVDTNGKGFNVYGAKLTVDGTLYLNKTEQGTTVGDYRVYDNTTNPNITKTGKVVVNGYIKATSEPVYDGKNFPAGAYYYVFGNESFYYITTVANAAQAAQTADNGITIYGKNTTGDVEFTGTADEPVQVTIDAKGELTASSLKLTYAVLNIDGRFDGTVTSDVGSVELVNVTGIDFVSGVDGDDVAYFGMSGTPAKIGTKTKDPDASVTVSAGNVTVIDATEFNVTTAGDVEFGIASGATLAVAGDLTSQTDMTVEGTLAIQNGGSADIDGIFYVVGTVTVAAATEQYSAGTLAATTMYVGVDDEYNGAGSASVAASSISGLTSAYVLNGTTVSKDILKGLTYTTGFYVEGELWITAYTNGGVKAVAPGTIPTENVTLDKWTGTKADGTTAEVAKNAQFDAGTPARLDAKINYDIYVVTVFADPGITAVYIDGKLMTEGYYEDSTTGQWVQGFKLNVAAGEHEITYKLGNYFSGEATMTVNGDSVSGNKFTTSGTEPDDLRVTVYLQGIEPSAPETPSTGSSDDGMGLTDYLLIILVVLIVIMAIMVAMRLMRS